MNGTPKENGGHRPSNMDGGNWDRLIFFYYRGTAIGSNWWFSLLISVLTFNQVLLLCSFDCWTTPASSIENQQSKESRGRRPSTSMNGSQTKSTFFFNDRWCPILDGNLHIMSKHLILLRYVKLLHSIPGGRGEENGQIEDTQRIH